MKPSKFFVLGEIEKMLVQKPDLIVADLGSGQSKNFVGLLKKYPTMRYVGFEPNVSEANHARLVLKQFPHASVVGRLGYGDDDEELKNTFDVVISLSVLEHVKYLEPFLNFSVHLAKIGGRIIHLYDLGHALYPSNIKERIHVALCTMSHHSALLKKILPETKFASYVHLDEVQHILEKNNTRVQKVTYHNNPSLISLTRTISQENLLEILPSIVNLEEQIAITISDGVERERMFPSLCVWSRKDQ